MPKLKTNKAASKRYGKTGKGQFTKTNSNCRHLLANKTKRQKKTASAHGGVIDKSCEKTIKKLLPYA